MKVLKSNSYFLVPYFLFLLIGIVLLLSFNKVELYLFLTKNRSVFSDYFFMIWTELGGTLPYIFIALYFFYRYSTALYLTVSQAFGGIISVALKKLVGAPRPKLYFKTYFPEETLPQVEGFHLYSNNSFPSGHTITAFALLFAIALISKSRIVQFTAFVFASLVGYSRVYLSQHFMLDVLVGSIIGVACAWLCLPLYKKWDGKLKNRSLRDAFAKSKHKNSDKSI